MSSDPAINAADKVCERFVDPRDRIVALAAAREALAPLRVLHRPVDIQEAGTVRKTHCAGCLSIVDVLPRAIWPCATAKLIYPAEELR